MNSQPQNRTINRCHSFDFPVCFSRVLRDQLIEARNILCRALEQRVCKLPRCISRFRTFPKFCFEFLQVLRAHLGLKQHLHRVLACLGSQTHVTTVALSFWAPRSLQPAAFSIAVPFQSPLIPPRILCCHSSIQPDQLPVPACLRLTHKKSPALPYPFAPT